MRVGISGTHGTGKTTLAGALCARLPGHVMADEPYYLLEEEGHELGFPPSLEDYRALLECSVRSLSSPLPPGIVFDRTPLDYLAYMATTGANPSDEAGAAALQPAFREPRPAGHHADHAGDRAGHARRRDARAPIADE